MGLDKPKKPTYYEYMKKIFISFSTSLLSLFGTTQIAFAQQNIVTCTGQFANLCNLTGNNFGSFLGQVINFAFVAAIVIALGFLIWGGIKWVTSGGEKGGVEEARNHVIAAVVGLIIVFLSYFILNLIVFVFTGTSLSNITLPSIGTKPTTP